MYKQLIVDVCGLPELYNTALQLLAVLIYIYIYIYIITAESCMRLQIILLTQNDGVGISEGLVLPQQVKTHTGVISALAENKFVERKVALAFRSLRKLRNASATLLSPNSFGTRDCLAFGLTDSKVQLATKQVW
jgi:hypothetical protein